MRTHAKGGRCYMSNLIPCGRNQVNRASSTLIESFFFSPSLFPYLSLFFFIINGLSLFPFLSLYQGFSTLFCSLFLYLYLGLLYPSPWTLCFIFSSSFYLLSLSYSFILFFSPAPSLSTLLSLSLFSVIFSPHSLSKHVPGPV